MLFKFFQSIFNKYLMKIKRLSFIMLLTTLTLIII